MKKILKNLAFLAMVFGIMNPAVADVDRLLEMLLEKGILTKSEYEELRQRDEAQNIAKQEAAEATESGFQSVIVSTTGGLRGRTADDSFTFRLGGRVVVDGAVYDSDAEDLGNGSELRATRLEVEGTLWSDWGFRASYDFAENEVDLKSNFIQYHGFEPLRIRAGFFKEPFSLEEQTRSIYNTFMERALPNVLVPERNIGLGFHSDGDRWSADLGFFGEGVDDQNDDAENDESYGVTSRATFRPLLLAHNKFVHTGASASYRDFGDTGSIRFRARPESHITNTRFVNTGRISDIRDTLSYGAETALVYGPFSLQGEYIAAELNRGSGFSDLNFDGYYIYGSWFLTGESRTYRERIAEFGRIKPFGIVGKGGIGAWEFAVRYSGLDLNDGSGVSRIRGGREQNITVGLNWYATPNIRFMANYINVDAEKDDEKNENPNIFQLRGQVDF